MLNPQRTAVDDRGVDGADPIQPHNGKAAAQAGAFSQDTSGRKGYFIFRCMAGNGRPKMRCCGQVAWLKPPRTSVTLTLPKFTRHLSASSRPIGEGLSSAHLGPWDASSYHAASMQHMVYGHEKA